MRARYKFYFWIAKHSDSIFAAIIIFTLISLVLIVGLASAHTLTWNDNSNNEDGFILESCAGDCRTNPAAIWSEASRFGANIVTASIVLSPKTSYRMLAFNIAGKSGPSNVVFIGDSPAGVTNFVIGP